MQAVCNAVNFLHENRLLHLDIKPQNLVLRTDRQTRELTPVLIDFGLTRHFDKKGNPTSQSEMKSHTDGYAPMEQYVGITSFVPTADVYAMGALLFFMLTGKAPVIATECSQSYLKSNIPVDVSDGTRDAILQAMQSSPRDRTKSVELFANNLGIKIENVVVPPDSGKSVTVVDPVPDEDGWVKWVKKHLSTLVIMVLAVALVIALFARRTPSPIPAQESHYVADVQRILADSEKSMNIDSLLFANECMDKAERNGENDPTARQELTAAIDKLFSTIVANGDNSSLPEVKRNCYSQALQLKYDSEVENKLNQL